MEKILLLTTLFVLNLHPVYCQVNLYKYPLLKEIDNKKEVKVYNNLGYMGEQMRFDE